MIVEVIVGLISRASPALNYMVIGYPLRLIVGLTLLAVLVPVIPAVTNSLVDSALMTGAQLARAFR
jgi:flagellar biosynthetic protein FliR